MACSSVPTDKNNKRSRWDAKVGDCTCDAGLHVVEYDDLGVPLRNGKECAPCPAGKFVDATGSVTGTPDPYTCRTCGYAHSSLSKDGKRCECIEGFVERGLAPLVSCIEKAKANQINYNG